MNKAERFSPSDPLSGLFRGRDSITLGGVPDGLEGRILGRLAEAEGTVVFVARDARRLANAEAALGFFAPGVATLSFPAWDSPPYDRVSPTAEVSARRMSALHALLSPHDGPRVVFTTANAVVQRVPDRESVGARVWAAAAGAVVSMDQLAKWLERNGFDRTTTVRDVGEYAVRGGILDLWAPGTASPIRLDFFGDILETIRPFDAASQRTTGQQPRLDLVPASEAILTEETISRFRQNYRAAFGAVTGGDPLYEAVSDGRRFAGMEHWLPFFYERLETLFDYLSGAPVILDHLVEETIGDRLDQVRDHYEARREAASMGAASGSAPYKPIQPDALYLSKESWRSLLADIRHAQLSPFAQPEGCGQAIDMGGRSGRTFAAERTAGDVNVFDALVDHLSGLRKAGRAVMLASWSEGARDRLGQVLLTMG
jgi:transcription-repair coupling factor (superfamily II helicase)